MWRVQTTTLRQEEAIIFVAKWGRKYPILKKYRADRDIAYFTYMDFLRKCKGAYIRLTGLKGSIGDIRGR